eukprot:CAMPEP_0181449704 /NCGR_PEP_ID=MMETSP1110-20121109/27797_1 /TAXON_ID=174948 /ORGANISM="Symbiodinium sp., Strain CCMP421" /LENGTH=101 /DNA_ID=CAMNT_0023573901 /DNA_START=65 /DNA_END=370 /DNA_ORIENTATION=+
MTCLDVMPDSCQYTPCATQASGPSAPGIRPIQPSEPLCRALSLWGEQVPGQSVCQFPDFQAAYTSQAHPLRQLPKLAHHWHRPGRPENLRRLVAANLGLSA